MPPRKNGKQPVKADTPPMTFDISPNVLALRSSWKWAAVCEYLHKFMPALNVEGYTIQALEDDLADTTFMILPKLLHRMLYTLTLDRRINAETWEIYLRKQHLRRSAGPYPLGTDEEPIEWASLPTLTKLDLFHAVCEWPFYNPTRLRTAMNDEDNFANWRAEPIGWDSKRNAYWFFGGERLWIQRARPVPPRPKKTAQKKASSAKSKKASNTLPPPPAKKRGRPARHLKEVIEVSARSSDNGSSITSTRLRKRAAPDDGASSSSKRTRRSTRVSMGTRASTRLNGGDDAGDVWQRVPKEWLLNADTNEDDDDFKVSKGKGKEPESSDESDEANSDTNANTRISGLKSEDESDLTELSDDEPQAESRDAVKGEEKDEGTSPEPQESVHLSSTKDEEDNDTTENVDGKQAAPEQEEDNPTPDPKLEDVVASPEDPNFIEWETICVTIDDWNAIVEQFSKSTSTYEKALHKTLTKFILPEVMALWEERKKVVHQIEAVVGRKRSSRLAVIENEKERVRQEQQAQMEVDAKMDRTRRMEARERAQVAERDAREERRKERELRIQKEKEEAEERERREAEAARYAEEVAARQAAAAATAATADKNMERAANGRPIRKKAAAARIRMAAATNDAAENEEHWELDCEVCHRKGWNMNDGRKITACEKCSKWQHIECHDFADDQAGRPRRDWNSVDFLCSSCQAKPNRIRSANPRTSYPQRPGNAITPGIQKGHSTISNQPYSQLPYSPNYPNSNGVASHYPQVAMHPIHQPQQVTPVMNGNKPSVNQTLPYGKVPMHYATSPYGQYPGYYSQQQPYGSMHAPSPSQGYGKSALPAVHPTTNIAGHTSTPGYLASSHVPGQGQVAGASRTAYPVAYTPGRSSVPSGQAISGYWPYGYPGAQQPQAQTPLVNQQPPPQPTPSSAAAAVPLPNNNIHMTRPLNGSPFTSSPGMASSSPYPTYSTGPTIAIAPRPSVPVGSLPIGSPAPPAGQYLPPPPSI
ncbi:hypothetical protein FRC03_002729 [Tulasnella sp. 419]|nr:hypothetical protein FRC03_002729 [Tulasnella sp. 419]